MAISRRRALRAGLVGVLGGVSGCLTKTRTVFNRDTQPSITLSIKTVPSDSDPRATRIAQTLAANLTAAGVQTEVTPMAQEELFRDVLVNHDFDLYVARYTTGHDPDWLRTLFHSQFNTEPGWQNPSGFSDLDVDHALVAQKQERGAKRRETVREIQRQLAEKQPITVLAFPDEIRALRSHSFEGWTRYPLSSPLGYLALEASGPSDSRPSLTVTVTDGRITKNLNPLTVEFRDQGLFTGLLYDPLHRWVGDELVPWLATSASWRNGSLRVSLRDDCQWHDDTPVTAEDVAFTYRFYRDTSLGNAEQPIPAPRFRGRSSLVESASVVDDGTVRLDVDTNSERVGRRALSLPILPRHIWETRTGEADLVGGLDPKPATEAIIDDNLPAVGSGPLAFERAIGDESLILSRNDGHFLNREDAGPFPGTTDAFSDVAFDRLVTRVVPSAQAAVELVAAGEADATASSGTAEVVPTIGREDSVSLNVTPSRSFYHVGYNNRRPPLQNPRFRRVVARLIDKATIVSDVFDGYAQPAATPLAGTPWASNDLRWNDGDPKYPFLGSDGELDVADARDAFLEAGYRYEDGVLVGGAT